MDTSEVYQLGFTTEEMSLRPSSSTPFQPTTIPIEIWSNIFSMAVYIPGAYDIQDYSAILAFTRDTHGICLQDVFWQSMRTKLACSRVCKYWNAISQPFLFQYLRIESGKQACAIANALEQAPQGTDEKGGGKWTLRVDLALEGEHAWELVHDEAMGKIFRHCENLVCFSDVFSKWCMGSQESERMISRLAGNPKFKRLEIKNFHNTLSVIEKTLGDTLEVLWLVQGSAVLMNVFLQKPTYFLSKLCVLINDACLTPEVHLTLPNLRVYVGERYYPYLHCKPHLLEQFSGHFNTFVLQGPSLWSSLTTLCLQSAQLLFCDFTSHETFGHSGLRYIIIEDFAKVLLGLGLSPSFKPLQEHSSCLRKNLSYFISRDVFPNMYGLRLHLPVSCRGLPQESLRQDKEFWIVWFDACHNHGLRLEISRGSKERFEDKWSEIPAKEFIQYFFESEEISL